MLVLSLLLLCAACAAPTPHGSSDAASDGPSTSRLARLGFSLAAPVDPRWRIPSAEQRPDRAVLRLESTKPSVAVEFSVALEPVDGDAFDYEVLEAFADATLLDRPRDFDLFTGDVAPLQGQPGLLLESVCLPDAGDSCRPGFTSQVLTHVVAHPDFAHFLVHSRFRMDIPADGLDERFVLQTTAGEIDDTMLGYMGMVLLNSVRLDDHHGVPIQP